MHLGRIAAASRSHRGRITSVRHVSANVPRGRAAIKGAPAATPRQSLTVTHSDNSISVRFASPQSHLKHGEQKRQGEEDSSQGQENPTQAPEAPQEAVPGQGPF